MARERIEIKNKSKFRKVLKNYEEGLLSITDAANLLGMSRTTFYRRMEEIRALSKDSEESANEDSNEDI